MDENDSQPIGEPEPMETQERRGIFESVVVGLTIALGSFLAVSFLATPRRLAGATRSARLLWQQRDKEIRQCIARSDAAAFSGQATEANARRQVEP